jgi:transcriptional regulator with XRE-family HTH domain
MPDDELPTRRLRHLGSVPSERFIFGRNFKRAREAANLSQRDVSSETGLTQGWVSAIERGEANVTIETMATLARLVRRAVPDLLDPDGGSSGPAPGS